MSKANRYDEFTIQEQEHGPPLVVDRFGGERNSTRVERALWEILNRDDDKARVAILKARIAELEHAAGMALGPLNAGIPISPGSVVHDELRSLMER